MTLVVAPARAARADEPTSPPRASTLTTLSPASRAILQQTARKSEQTQAPNSGGDQAFFKSPKGALVIALIGAGAGYALYSKVHDRVASPVR